MDSLLSQFWIRLTENSVNSLIQWTERLMNCTHILYQWRYLVSSTYKRRVILHLLFSIRKERNVTASAAKRECWNPQVGAYSKNNPLLRCNHLHKSQADYFLFLLFFQYLKKKMETIWRKIFTWYHTPFEYNRIFC